mmetsp:Transcript_128525/g.357795  ORF Transcript_128525/g.357795 Transcript_128525/m.357795 type:complete len:253 (-) Transcript_128525:85-843(-)
MMWGKEGVVSLKPEHVDESGRTLYQRLGGEEPLVTMVYGVYDLMRADPELGPFFERFAKSPATFKRLKERTVEYLGGEWGGTPYEGPDLFVAHASMSIDDFLYDGMMKMYAVMLKKLEADQDVMREVLDSLEKMRPPIVDPGGVFQKQMEKRLAAATAQRRQRLAEFKKRQEEEAMAKKEAKAGRSMVVQRKPSAKRRGRQGAAPGAPPAAGPAGTGAAHFAFTPCGDAPPQQPPASPASPTLQRSGREVSL